MDELGVRLAAEILKAVSQPPRAGARSHRATNLQTIGGINANLKKYLLSIALASGLSDTVVSG